jgi:ribosomal protein S18 acetylase RimI-like enzyme
VIGDLYVSNGNRGPDRHEVETRLLTHVIETLQQSPGIHRIEAQLLVHESGEVSRPFTDQGFGRHSRIFMELPLAGKEEMPPAHPEIEIRRWTEQDYQPAAAVITTAYRGHVDAQINDQYRTLSGSLRFLNNIVRFPGCGMFDAESSFVAVHKRSHAIVGVVLCSRVRHDVGHITQVCVLPEYRSHGVGVGLLAASAHNLRRRSFAMLSLTVTEANTRAVELYKRLGFTTERVFDAFVWEG